MNISRRLCDMTRPRRNSVYGTLRLERSRLHAYIDALERGYKSQVTEASRLRALYIHTVKRMHTATEDLRLNAPARPSGLAAFPTARGDIRSLDKLVRHRSFRTSP